MRFTLKCFMCILLAAAIPLQATCEELFYVRIVAHDDTSAAQQRKRQAVGLILPMLPALSQMDDEIAVGFAQHVLQQHGFGAQADIRIWQPDVLHPAEKTLYITLGLGGGRNWWGILCQDTRHWSFLQQKSGALSGTASNRFNLVFPFFGRILSVFGFGQHHLEIGEVRE